MRVPPRHRAAMPGDKYPDLQFIMFRRGRRTFMVACRGAAKGCNVQAKQRQKLGPCSECIECTDDETLEQVYLRIQRGDS